MYPVELLLIIISYLNTADVVVLGQTCRHLHAIAENERNKRQDIDRLLSRYVDNPEHFRHLMRDTGAIIVGDFARAFFTGEDTPVILELLFRPQERTGIDNRLKPWASFISNSGIIQSPLQRVNSDNHWTTEVSAFSQFLFEGKVKLKSSSSWQFLTVALLDSGEAIHCAFFAIP